MNYTIKIEKLRDVYQELEPLYRQHYAEMATRLEGVNIEVSCYHPRLDEYFCADDAGDLLTFVLRYNGIPCGYANVYLTNDMHNRDLIAQEDVLFVEKKHRNGIGKRLVQFGIEELRKRGVRRLNVSAVTDLRVVHLWKRMGFKETATQMTYTF